MAWLSDRGTDELRHADLDWSAHEIFVVECPQRWQDLIDKYSDATLHPLAGICLPNRVEPNRDRP
jgi:hypothetical protein